MHGQRVLAQDIKPDKVQKFKYKMKDFKCCEKLVWEDKERGRIKYLLSSARCWLDKVGTLPLGWLIPSGKIGNTRSANLSQATGCKYIWWNVKSGWKCDLVESESGQMKLKHFLPFANPIQTNKFSKMVISDSSLPKFADMEFKFLVGCKGKNEMSRI